ncbi:hypothetical protein KY285_001846 [Solanum tuberosum]|nr:hypothetical protein KY289_002120 [Solanum tuberosum]KAH0765975.1 hypothetical protein KY285_001846 [Solanum tuberosum]
MKKIEVAINKTVKVALPKTKDNCNAIKESMTELKKRSESEQQLDAADKQGTPQSHNTTTMPSRKRMSNMSTKRVGVAPRQKQLSSFKKIQKQSVNTEKKRGGGSQQTPTQRSSVNAKSMPPPLPLMKMTVATKPVEVAHQKQLSDCSPQKQSNCSSITRPMQKDTQSISNTKKIESSKRKFEERLAEQRESKRRIVMVDFHNMLKSANDSHAPKRCWDRRRS